MKVQAGVGGKQVTSDQMLTRSRTGDLPVPFAEIETLEAIATGFRVEMFEVGDDKVSGGVATGSGFGSDFMTLTWGDRTALVRGVDILRAWVATFDPESAKRFPAGLGEAPAKSEAAERVYDRAKPGRLGWVTKSAGMNAYVEWDDGATGWCAYADLGGAPFDDRGPA